MRRCVVSCLAFCYLLAAGADLAPAQPLPQAAPSVERPPSGTGFVPPRQDLSHVAPPPISAAILRDLPARFDWREQGMLSPVKNQGACGSCYAFAAAGDLESRVLRDYDTLVDLSENHLKECHFEARSCAGGNAQIVVNLLTLQGAVLEACDPYVAADVDCNTTCAPQYAVRDWIWLAGDTLPATADLKQALVDHGPLSSTVYAGDSGNPAWQSEFNGWNGGDGLYYAGGEQPNHAVMLVGWDDDHPHTGGGQGCWIIKNSWGQAWGDTCGYGATEGYCYLAYGAAGIGKWTSAITAIMPVYPELAVMAWDEGGWTSAFGYGQPVAWGLARYVPAETTNVHCVEFWTTDAASQVDVYVYAAFNGSTLSGLLAAELDLSFAAAGYHSVALSEPLPIAAAEDYYVAVRFQNVSYVYPLAVDQQGAREAGRTWISSNASSWIDLGDSQNCEAGIRIRTSPHTTLPVSEPDEPRPPEAPHRPVPFTLEPAWPNPFNPATSLAFTLGERSHVSLRVYDLQGRLVDTLVEAELPAGRHLARWTGRDHRGRHVPAGVYLCRLDDGWHSRSQRMVLLK